LRILSYPFDEIFIYGFSLCIVFPFLLEMLALHHVTPDDKKFWSHAALIFTIIYSVFVTANYVVQLATVIPMTLKGISDKISILVQTPHSLFWDFDAIGYISMGFATLLAVPVFKKQGFQRWVRISFLANALVTPLIAFVYFYPEFSERILLLGIPWAITAPMAMLFLAIMFKKEYRNRKKY
jgi:heme/copper-type cytochrome/quinol oxidase subunit 4